MVPGDETTMENTATWLLPMSTAVKMVSRARLSCSSGMGRKKPCTTGAFTGTGELISEALVPSVTLVAVKVQLPMLFKVTLKVAVPPTRSASGGSVALGSVVSRCTVSVTAPSRFQFASTALTVIGNGMPAACARGVPVLPVGVPGAAVSPGTRTCSFANSPPPSETDVDETGVSTPLVNRMVIVLATGCAKSVKDAIPSTAAMLVEPCNVPVPPLRVAVIVSVSALRRLPY